MQRLFMEFIATIFSNMQTLVLEGTKQMFAETKFPNYHMKLVFTDRYFRTGGKI